MDLTKKSKKSKVLPARQDFNVSVQQPDVSSATQTVQDPESRVFCDGTNEVDKVNTATPDNAKLCSNFEPVNGPIIQDKEQLIGEDVIIAEETPSLPEQERSDELVCGKKDVSCVTNILPSSKNHEEIVKATSCQEIRARKHPIRLTRTGKCGVYKNCFHVTKEHDFPCHKAKEGIVFEQCKQKVGLVRCMICGNWGTCFRIGKCYILTCYHVISKCTGTDHQIKAFFRNQGPNQRDTWDYKIREKNIDKKIDFAICELYSDGKSFPPAFTNFRDSTHADSSSECLVYLICFQDDANQIKLDVHYDTVRLNSNTFDSDRLNNLNRMVKEKYPKYIEKQSIYWDADSHRYYGHVPLLSKVTHGGSGGVGVSFDGNGNVVVDFMYKAGFPGFFETASTDEKENFPICLCVEVGSKIRTIMKKSDKELWEC
ncbi:uncharacterized protein LOC110465893 [Mizuhopecten yessoensis]|uniref:Uncharacterized protein n=1 Tax=Mizuhopecten yessoensis TaxID=6573 RepID=A0A210PQK8_MIZYE|nr:uncharacterized protein LOC110465893 [Mizuhopecten yessoensis]OWF38790.1 hypothetical protein KP79_PYT16674 [Mizuhopecten yessoensis]